MYASKVTKQLESVKKMFDLKPADLRLSHMKPFSGQWIVEANACVRVNWLLVYKGFENAGYPLNDLIQNNSIGVKITECS